MSENAAAPVRVGPLRESLQAHEKSLIVEALRIHQGNKVGAARDLGIGLSSLYRKMKELGIQEEGREPWTGKSSPPPS